MIRLSTTGEKLQAVLGGAVTTNQLHCVVCYSDDNGTTYVGGTQYTSTNDTTAVDICAAPAASTVRDIDYINIRNRDTAVATVTVMVDVSATDSELVKATLAVGDQLVYTHSNGWATLDSAGQVKSSASGGTSYTDEEAQDAVGTILTDSSTIDFTYDDATPEITASVKSASITNAMLAFDGGAFSFRNRLINPRGAIYQRAVAATADDAYFADRWYMLTQTGTVTPSVLTDPEDGYPTGIRITQSQASAQRFGFAQIIEGKNCKDMRGESGVLVPRIRASASQAIRYAILGWTGTEDAVTSDVVNDWTSGTYTAGNFFNSTTLSVIAVGSETPSANTWTSLAALTASLGSTFNNIVVLVWTEGTAAQNFTLDFDYVQFEKGSTATPFETRSVGQELSLCQRYYYQLGNTGTFMLLPTDGQRVSTNIIDGFILLPATMRVAPTVSSSSPSYNAGLPSGNQVGFYNNWTAGYATISGSLTLSAGAAEPGGILFRATAGTSFSGTSGNTGHWYFGSTAYITMSAEL